MSLLFDALQRSQVNNADSAKTLHAISGKSVGIIYYARYVLPVLALLGGAWYLYLQNLSIPFLAQETIADTAPADRPQLDASLPVSAVAVTGAILTEADTSDASFKKQWAQPLKGKKRLAKKRKLEQAPAKMPTIPEQDNLQDGYLALSEGHLDQAEQIYLAEIKQHPHEKDALLGLAMIAHRKLQMDKATSLYQQVLREDLGNAAAAAGLISLLAQADPMSAESQLKELIDIKPAAPEFHYALGVALAHQQRWGEAQQAFFRACRLEPASALYAYNMAVSLDHLRQSAAALPYYEKASKLAKPNDPILDQDAIVRRIHELRNAATHQLP